MGVVDAVVTLTVKWPCPSNCNNPVRFATPDTEALESEYPVAVKVYTPENVPTEQLLGWLSPFPE
jgi:hypothetical protein